MKTHKNRTDFLICDTGVFLSRENAEPQFICSKLEVVAKIRTDENKGWGRALRLVDDDGVVHSLIMPMEVLAGNSNDFIAQLLNLGLKIGQGRAAKDHLIHYLSNYEPSKRARCVYQIGWYGESYVLPDQNFGKETNEEVFYQAPNSIKTHFHTKGNLLEWQENVGKFCSQNSRLTFALSVALAAPFLKLMHHEGGGFHFRCSSSKGKTTTLVVAGSVWGGGNGNLGFVESWRNTLNGLESVATQHNDSLLVLDEISQLNPKEAADVTYLLANGKGKGRANQFGGSRKRAEWNLLFLSSGETSLLKLIEQAGARAYAGQEVRMLDIPAEVEGGFGLFENIHGFSSPQHFADTIKSNAKQFYGTPIRHFLSLIVQNIPEYIEKIRNSISEFISLDLEGGEESSEIIRVKSRMGLVAAVGELAIELSILPLQKGDALSATEKCFKAWKSSRGGSQGLDTIRGLQQLRAFLLEFGSSRFPLISETQQIIEDRSQKRAGFRKDYGGGHEWLIFKDVFRNEICKGLDHKALEKKLVEDGYLIPDNEGNPTSPQRIPGGGRVRVYVIHPCVFD